MTMAQLAMRWILDQPAVSTVIAGASRPEQVAENASASRMNPLPAALHQKLEDLYRREIAPAIRVPI
jgi:aryl-alcohol dehydrogenase-like predicted oxidoreductase